MTREPPGNRSSPEPIPSVRSPVLVTIPVHNEEPRIRRTVDRVMRALDAAPFPYTLSVAEDASTDGTLRVLEEMRRDHPELLVRSRPHGRGRGSALASLWTEVDAPVYAYVDADLAMGERAVVDCIAPVYEGTSSVVTASRYCPGAAVRRPPLVHAVSLAYNRIIRLVFQDGVYDHQCGLKVFRRDVVRSLLERAHDGEWFWDTEMLVLAKAAGYSVTEQPVTWQETKNSRTSWRRLATEIPVFAAAIVALKGSGHLWGPGNASVPGPRSLYPNPIPLPVRSSSDFLLRRSSDPLHTTSMAMPSLAGRSEEPNRP